MEKRANLEKFLSVKPKFKTDINFSNVLAKQFITIIYEAQKLNHYSQIVKLCFKTNDFKQFANTFKNFETVCSIQVKRNDYIELIKLYTKEINNVSEPYCFEEITKLNCFSIKNIFLGFQIFLFYNNLIKKIKHKIYLYSFIVHYLNQIDSLKRAFEDIEMNKKKYIPFNSAFDIENLYTQFFNTKGTKTYHISHGLTYINYKNDLSYDYVNGLNIAAKEILVWGNSSKSNLINNYNYKPSVIFVTGNPKYSFKNIDIKQTFNNCIVFLARPIFDQYNEYLLNVLIDFNKKNPNVKFSIKPHPFSNIELFESICISNNFTIIPKEITIFSLLQTKKYDFSIVYNTTVYYEALYYDLLSFRFSVAECEDFIGLDDKFFDSESLKNQIAKFKNINKVDINTIIENLLIDSLGMGINSYKNILQSECFQKNS